MPTHAPGSNLHVVHAGNYQISHAPCLPCSLILASSCCCIVRACEFILLLLKKLHDDRGITLSAAANEVYYQTLNKNHAWYTAAAFVVALKVRTPTFLFLCMHWLSPHTGCVTTTW